MTETDVAEPSMRSRSTYSLPGKMQVKHNHHQCEGDVCDDTVIKTGDMSPRHRAWKVDFDGRGLMVPEVLSISLFTEPAAMNTPSGGLSAPKQRSRVRGSHHRATGTVCLPPRESRRN